VTIESRPGKSRVAIVYPFFPHYRCGFINELRNSERFDYEFYGDPVATDPTIRPYNITGQSFRKTLTLRLGKSIIWQTGLLRLALDPDVSCIIYLANPRFLTTWLSALLARLSGKRILFWAHGWTHLDSRLRASCKRLFFGLSDGLLLYGHYARARGVAAGFEPSRLYVIYNSLDYSKQSEVRNGISPALIDELRQSMFPGSAAPIAVHVGRLTSGTRLDLLLQAQRLLRERGHEVNVAIMGDGVLANSLKNYAKENRLPVAFLAECYDETQLGLLFRSAAVCVAPGKVGLTAMHSLAYGTPVITHSCREKQMPEFEAVLPGRTGSLFEDGDVESLAECILTWTTPRKDLVEVRNHCIDVILEWYNPARQRRVLEGAILGLPAEDDGHPR
jgi:glycosyltransferase involved in cell wall biosynthesis